MSITADGWTKTQGSEHVLNLMPHVMAVHPEASETLRCQVNVAGPPDDMGHVGMLVVSESIILLLIQSIKQTNKQTVERSINKRFSVVACLEIMIKCKTNALGV